MYILNKIVGGCLNPLVVGMALMLIACIGMWLKRRRIGVGFAIAAIGWLWLWSTPMMYRWIGVALEREWPMVKAEDAWQQSLGDMVAILTLEGCCPDARGLLS